VPLALCDARTLAREDLIEADAVFDEEASRNGRSKGWSSRTMPRIAGTISPR
jgi:hypothetical protein